MSLLRPPKTSHEDRMDWYTNRVFFFLAVAVIANLVAAIAGLFA